MTSTAVDFEAIKDKQRAGWQTGDYPRVGNTLQIIAELLVELANDSCTVPLLPATDTVDAPLRPVLEPRKFNWPV